MGSNENIPQGALSSVVRAGVHADLMGLFQMNAAPALLSIPEYDYVVVKLWERSTHANSQGGKIERTKSLLQRSNSSKKHNFPLGSIPLGSCTTGSGLLLRQEQSHTHLHCTPTWATRRRPRAL